MSLIIDALKKAQQLQLKGEGETPTLKTSFPNKKREKGSKKQWTLIGMSLLGLCIVILLLSRPSSPTQTARLHQASVSIEGKPILSAAKTMASEPLTPVMNYSENKESIPEGRLKTEGNSGKKVSPGITPSPPPKEKVAMKKEGPPEKQSSLKGKEKSLKKVAEEMNSPAPPAVPKVETPLASMGVKQENGRDQVLASEILAHFNSGVTFYNQKNYPKAIQAYQKVIEMDPAYVEAYNNLGVTYQKLGDLDRAFEAYQRVTAINPSYEKGYNNLGTLLLLKDRYDEAMEAFQTALTINPSNIATYLRIGILYKKKGEGEKAVESFQKALSIDPLCPEIHYHIALVYEQSGKLELAIYHFQQFLRLASKSQPELASKVESHLSVLVNAKREK